MKPEHVFELGFPFDLLNVNLFSDTLTQGAGRLKMKIFLTGGSGFVGRVLVKTLLENGFQVTCLVRPGSEEKWKELFSPSLQLICGDITQPSSYGEGLEGRECVIHLVGIIREFPAKGIQYQKIHVEGTQNLVMNALKRKCKRFIYMSALGARASALARYHQTKYQAEEVVRRSGLNYTIFQPSVIFGPDDRFINMLARMVRLNPITPLIGGGKNKLQPIFVSDISKGILLSLNEKRAFYRTYPVGGLEAYSMKHIFTLIKKALGIKRPNIRIPLLFIKPVVKIMEPFPFFPLTSDQLTMLKEDNTCDPTLFFEHFKMAPMPFPEGIKNILRH
ncbi:MAG TPA: complex I NDUFA9 subunit family protein [Nitrospiria bacterium]|jgi:NADH dehydrogenase